MSALIVACGITLMLPVQQWPVKDFMLILATSESVCFAYVTWLSRSLVTEGKQKDKETLDMLKNEYQLYKDQWGLNLKYSHEAGEATNYSETWVCMGGWGVVSVYLTLNLSWMEWVFYLTQVRSFVCLVSHSLLSSWELPPLLVIKVHENFHSKGPLKLLVIFSAAKNPLDLQVVHIFFDSSTFDKVEKDAKVNSKKMKTKYCLKIFCLNQQKMPWYHQRPAQPEWLIGDSCWRCWADWWNNGSLHWILPSQVIDYICKVMWII